MVRKQCIYVNGVSSYLSDTTMGVHQGTCMEPVLFLLYTNDVYKSAPLLKFLHFADDTSFARVNLLQMKYPPQNVEINLPSLINKFKNRLQFVDDLLFTNRLFFK